MPPSVPSATTPISRPGPRCAIASWIVLSGGLLATFIVYEIVVARPHPGEWFPGIGEALIGIAITGIAAFGCGLAAVLRRERRWWLAIVPLLLGLGTTLYFALSLLLKR